MKRLFLFAAMAVTMTVGCQKIQAIFNPGQDSLDDGSPVPVTLGTNVSATATTKASVTDLTDQTIHVFGLLQSKTDLSNAQNYLLGSPTGGDKIEKTTSPYTTDKYYGTGNDDVYNFYGYYVGNARTAARWGEGATEPDAISATAEGEITIPVIIDGQDDILLAATDKDADVITSGSTLDRTRVYSAYSARRSVVPTLLFKHQLAQLTFKLENGTTLIGDATLNVTDLTVKSESKANLVLANNTGWTFTQTPDAEKASVKAFAIPKEKDDDNLAEFTANSSSKDIPGSIMVIPGQTEYDMVLSYVQNSGADDADDHEDDVELTVALASGEPFKAGYSYSVTVKVYASEAVVLNVSVEEWKTGESITIDEDQDDEVVRDNSKPYAVPTEAGDEGEIAYKVYVPDEMTNYTIQAALSESQKNVPDDAEWVDLVDTKAGPKFAVFENYLAGKIYYCHLRYRADDTEEFQEVKPSVTDYQITPAFEFTEAFLVEDEEDYNKLPEFYKTLYPWDANETELTTGKNKLPWLAAVCSPTDANVVTVKKDGEAIRTFEGDNWIPKKGLITVSANELGVEEFEAGNYTFVVNGVESGKIEVTAE